MSMTAMSRLILLWFLIIGGQVLLAQEKGWVDVVYRPLEASVARGTYTVTFIKEGKIVFQDEKPPYCPDGDCRGVMRNSGYGYNLPVGTYDVRVEGEGAITVVKYGIAVTSAAGRQILFDLRSGQGVKIFEYAKGVLTREEMATRLKELEAVVQELKANMVKIVGTR
jgi:hypothetical protein